MTRGGRLPCDAGVTLVELLVALSVMGLLSVLLLGSLEFGSGVWKRADEDLLATGRSLKLQSALVRELAQIYPFHRGDAVVFDGAAHVLSYLAPDPQVPGALDRVTISVADGTLVRRSVPELSRSSAQETVLSRDVGRLDFSYFGAQDGKPAGWHSNWHGQPVLPSLIRIDLDGSGFVMAPRIRIDTGCVLDALPAYCREAS
ncbi:MAG: prepilin-type N-terminal cleavage/methylation domain-containing protein [Alphaproteobacteria bacterium]|nr:prepilin-type N-terminal cleavage/methylation domain-containing protein [Alphaproteobacteria bacterium]